MKLKVCGLKNEDNIRKIMALRPDYMGFILYEKSQRYISKLNTGLINEISKSGIKKAGVFVNSSIQFIEKMINQFQLDVIQLHGKESPVFCYYFKTTGVKVIKVFPISERINFSAMKSYEKCCDYFLFDTKGKLPGGNGTKLTGRFCMIIHFQSLFF